MVHKLNYWNYKETFIGALLVLWFQEALTCNLVWLFKQIFNDKDFHISFSLSLSGLVTARYTFTLRKRNRNLTKVILKEHMQNTMTR